jgi:hypothetical protein
VPELPVVTVPHPLGGIEVAEVLKKVEDAVAPVVAGLSRPRA